MHWADVVADALAAQGTDHIVATGITPSGEFHIGHLREILTGDMIARAARSRGLNAELVFVVDNADPLRKVYPFLDESYEQFIGYQLGLIPAPDEDGKPNWERFNNDGWSYGDHFLHPFLQALEQIGVKPRLIFNLEMYQTGQFADAAKKACDQPHVLREIIERISGRELPQDWFPWQPIDDQGCLDGVRVTGYEYPLVMWETKDGRNGASNIERGEGKLPWRLDWPARWGFNRITCEPFGKDHGASGGSYDTGQEIARFFGHEPPHPMVYEWISLKGQGAMSSSAGNTIGPIEALQLVPPEILRFLIANTKPNKAIEFDTGMGLVTLADEYERTASRDFVTELNDESKSRRQKVQIEDAAGALNLSSVEAHEQAKGTDVSFRHLALLTQVKAEDEAVLESLQVNGEQTEKVLERIHRMRYWISSDHFPDEMRIDIMTQPHREALLALLPMQRSLLHPLLEQFHLCDWTSEGIMQAMKACVDGHEDASMRDVYRVAYAVYLGKEKGPRLAPILENCEKHEMMKLLSECIEIIS